MFADIATIFVKAGNGGDGAVTFHREKYVASGGPDGGDGGKGGDVILEVDDNLSTLSDFRYKRKYFAENGQKGSGGRCYGKWAPNLTIKVPRGTVVYDNATNRLIVDMSDKDSFVLAKGGKGGKGNPHFANSVRQAPNFAEAGGFSQQRTIRLVLKLIADVGLVGFPNVGKSTLLSVCTSASPKIGNYHFTTITPNLGVVQMYDKSFVMADIPGLIEGAHTGAGLGLDFLKHIERTKMLIHVVDVSGSEGRDPIEDFDKINAELSSYGKKLPNKRQIVAANKIDMASDEQYEALKAYVEEKGYEIYPISAPINHGVTELLQGVLRELEKLRALPEEEPEYEWFDMDQPEEDEEYREIYIAKDGPVYVLSGKQLEKIFNSTNFNDSGSTRYLYKYIEKKGAIERLKEMGIEDGDLIRIVDYEFEYYDE